MRGLASCVVTGLVVAVSVNCDWNLEGFTEPYPPETGPSSADGAVDSGGGQDGGGVVGGPHVATSTGAVATATGLAQQHHVVFAVHDRRYWLFYIDDDATKLKTKVSSNLADWTDGASFVLPVEHGFDGRNFSVAYTNRGGSDVVHIVFAHHSGTSGIVRRVFHTRAVIASGAITFGVPVQISSLDAGVGDNGCDPDGPSLALDGMGYVHDVTGWWTDETNEMYCDYVEFRSDEPDDGTTFGNTFTKQGFMGAHGAANAHVIVKLDTNELLAGFEYGDWDPTPSTISWARTSGNLFPAGVSTVFDGNDKPTLSWNDWSFCVANNQVHFVRRSLNAGANDLFDHRTLAMTEGSDWLAGAAMPNDPGSQATGVVTLTNGIEVGAFAIAADKGIRYSIYDGAAWSAWKTLVGTSALRSHLSGSGCEDPFHPTLIWSEGASGQNNVVTMDVSSVF